MYQEIEIRLAARPDDLRRLSLSRFVKRLSRGNAATRRYNTVYYDTAEFLLAKRGISLRVRRSGRDYVQTVEEKNIAAAVTKSAEWESPLPTPEPDLRFIPDPKMRTRLIALTSDKEIEAKLETKIRRTTRHLETEAGDEIAFATDSGEIQTLVDGREARRVSEVELQLKSGSPAALYEIARGLSKNARLSVAIESKAERDLRALKGKKQAAVKAGRITLPLGATAEDAFRVTLMHCLRHIARNAPVVSQAHDVEGLHQIRVGLRRLRAALVVFGQAFETTTLYELRAQAKLLGSAFGETRDLDVFAVELLPRLEAVTPGRASIAQLRKRLDTAREQSWARCAARADSEEFTRFLLDLAAVAEMRVWRHGAGPKQITAFTRPAAELARDALDKRERTARKRARHLASLNTKQRHRLRIALKKLRYTAEFFAPLFATKNVTRYLKKLSAAQDVFGAMNDAATVDHTLNHILENTSSGQSASLREGAALVEGWHLARVAPAWKDAKAHWKNLAKSKAFWTA